MSLHVPTLLLTASATVALLGVLFLVVARAGRSASALTWFGLAYLLAAVAILLIGARGALPGRLSIDIGNALLLLGYGLILAGAAVFTGRRIPRWVVPAGPLLWLAACQAPAFYASLDARVALATALLAGYCLAAAVVLARRGEPVLSTRWIAVALLGLHGASYAVRLPLTWITSIAAGPEGLPSGTWFAFLSLEALLHFVGLAFAFLAMERERAEAATRESLLAARDAAARASEAKSRFLARMTHELRTPLNGVLGIAQNLARDPRLSEDQRQQVATLERAGQHLLDVANDVLHLATVEAGKLQLRETPIAPGPFVEGCLALVRPAAEGRRIALSAEVPGDLPPAVRGDATRLRQILLNLLGNAVRHTPAGGQVRLRLRRAQEEGWLRFEVLDTGPGIPAERRGELFREFGRIEPAAENEFGSGGLGLAISAALASAMGGRIGCEAGEGGRGSLFWLELPLPACPPAERGEGPPSAPQAEEPREAPPPASRPRQRVLVVDDIAPNRLVARILLESAGHEVVLASGGAEAVAAAAEGHFDVILMDVHMPCMDGVEATRRIRAAEGGGPRARIYAVTADTAPEQFERCRAAGMDGRLLKPIDREGLLALVEGRRCPSPTEAGR
ncbi:MAG: response regulator [Roseococcus sp.]|nr:response regulator [Roseococcus sp.]